MLGQSDHKMASPEHPQPLRQIPPGFIQQRFFHLSGSFLLAYNAKLNKGNFSSYSYMARVHPELVNLATPYSALHNDVAKEQVFERVRAEEFPHKPTRLRSFFMFLSKEDAETASKTWFPKENRPLYEVWVTAVSGLHIADSNHLLTHPDKWEEAAHAYWRGDPIGTPALEVILDGSAYLPDWESLQPVF